MTDLSELTLDDFSDHLDESFRLTATVAAPGVEPLALELRLIEAVSLGGGAERGVRAPFSIVFSGPIERIAPQGIYRLEGERLRPLELFLVPIEPAAGAARYQAIFN